MTLVIAIIAAVIMNWVFSLSYANYKLKPLMKLHGDRKVQDLWMKVGISHGGYAIKNPWLIPWRIIFPTLLIITMLKETTQALDTEV